jgi:hypothetical protein
MTARSSRVGTRIWEGVVAEFAARVGLAQALRQKSAAKLANSLDFTSLLPSSRGRGLSKDHVKSMTSSAGLSPRSRERLQQQAAGTTSLQSARLNAGFDRPGSQDG